MLAFDFSVTLPGFTLEARCRLPAAGFTAVLGPSGCGKTTLAASVAGLRTPSGGRVEINEHTVFDAGRGINVPTESRGIGFVFQSHRLFPHMSVRDNLFFARRCGRKSAVNPDQLIEVLGIGPLLDRRAQGLSGGESQRVSLGRALLAAETLLIMDEPLASLDPERREELLGYFGRLREITSLPVLYITHAPEEAARLADTTVRMERGRVLSVEYAHA